MQVVRLAAALAALALGLVVGTAGCGDNGKKLTAEQSAAEKTLREQKQDK
jgi:hypothetical protein